MKQFNEIIRNFKVDGEITEVKPLGHGHVNHTYEVVCGGRHYVLQEINHVIFKYPVEVMNNLFMVTDYLRKQIENEGFDPHQLCILFMKTVHDNPLHQMDDGNFYRLYQMVESGDEILEKPHDPHVLYEIASALGEFQKYLAAFPVERLSMTFPKMHDMKACLHGLLDAVRGDIASRTSNCQEQIHFVLDRSEQLYRLQDALADGLIPKRVVHNDATYRNVLYDTRHDEAVCMIDLDTVMPGSSLFDFGEMVRTGAASVSDLDKSGDVELDLELFRAIAEGYLEYMGLLLNKEEKELLVYSCWLAAMESGMNYLTDYINGDLNSTDFSDEKQNLFRAVNQFYLVLDMEDKKDQMGEIVSEILMTM